MLVSPKPQASFSVNQVIGAATEAVELLLGPNRNELLHSCQAGNDTNSA